MKMCIDVVTDLVKWSLNDNSPLPRALAAALVVDMVLADLESD